MFGNLFVCWLVVSFVISWNDVFKNQTGNYLQFEASLSNLFVVLLAVPQCDPPVIPDSAVVYYPRKMRKRFKYSDRVLLKCKAGYFKSRGGVLSCKGTNQWTGDITCSREFC